MSLSDAKFYYRIKHSLVPTVRLCYNSVHKFKAEKWLCPDCLQRFPPELPPSAPAGQQQEHQLVGQPDSLDHIRYSCPINESLRENTDFDEPVDEVRFFREVVNRRKQVQLSQT